MPAVFAALAAWAVAGGAVRADEGHDDKAGPAATMDMMAEQMRDMMADWSGPRLVMPIMNSARGRKLFASKGCVTCHSINGVGGEDAPNLDAHTMMPFMNPFDFAARMWRGAGTMIALQEDSMGYQIEMTGDELADIIAFVHDEGEQHKFTESDIPPDIMPMMSHMHGDDGGAAAHAEELGHDDSEDAAHQD